MSALREAVPAFSAEPGAKLLDLVGAALKRFGPGIRLHYRTERAECVLAFPLSPTSPHSIQTSESQTCSP